jgi:hypothetical protein
MNPLRICSDYEISNSPPPQIPFVWQGVLNRLRIIALECRAAAHADLFEACALLSHKQDVAHGAYARAAKMFATSHRAETYFLSTGHNGSFF